ncbi:hypothetical protein EXIGLDRAFT_234380 [Exidia glandulosa HHB12029]|uniref:Uncharacterized protein n=1 Tax=Exidia glandulosa HHB12029 TaxID=1314781 RepID=A0A165MK43_EXIGL|nr:hypothetical protein EXIGLDRAFT_234380 [Exidia glandulosa HHB12029]
MRDFSSWTTIAPLFALTRDVTYSTRDFCQQADCLMANLHTATARLQYKLRAYTEGACSIFTHRGRDSPSTVLEPGRVHRRRATLYHGNSMRWPSLCSGTHRARVCSHAALAPNAPFSISRSALRSLCLARETSLTASPVDVQDVYDVQVD